MAHKTFTFNNVIIKELNMSNGVFNLIYSLPSVENKPYCLGLDVKEISLYEPPKYDPCRLFKKGDKVKLREKVQGRETPRFMSGLSLGKIYTVVHDEYKDHTVDIIGDECLGRYSFVYLELVTPVEELEPYYVGTWENMLAVYKKTQTEDIIISMFSQSHPHAKEAAEAECKRLNEEYRKEQNNDK
mgnify:CR=1 FL=1